MTSIDVFDQQTPNGTVYDLVGPAGKPVVALIHGLGLTRATWRDFVPALSERYRVLNYDLFGHGQSAAPTIENLTVFSEQFRLLLDHLAIDSCAAVGFSLGGMINRRLAIDHPERVDALAILNSPHERGAEAQRLVEERAAASAAGGPGATIDATLVRWFTPEFLEASPELVAEVKAWVLANNPPVYAEARMVLAQGVVELIAPNPPIAKPTLVMTCEHDSGSTPAMSRSIAAEIPGSEVRIVAGRQHLGLFEDPDAFIEPILAFLESHY